MIYLNGSVRDFRDAFVFAVPPGQYARDPSIKYLMAVAADHIAHDPTAGSTLSHVGHTPTEPTHRETMTKGPWFHDIKARGGPQLCQPPNCVTGLMGSTDLYHWTALPPIADTNGSAAGAPPECPDVFQMPNDPHWSAASRVPSIGCWGVGSLRWG